MCSDVAGHHLPFSGTWIQPRIFGGFLMLIVLFSVGGFLSVSFVHNVACIFGL
jgi:hypothetical protein